MTGEYSNRLCVPLPIWYPPVCWSLGSTSHQAFLLHCVVLRVAFIIAAMSACFPVAAESINLYYKSYRLSGANVFSEMSHGSRSPTSDHQGQLLRSVMLVSSIWSRATRGRKTPNTTHEPWPGLTKNRTTQHGDSYGTSLYKIQIA